MEDRQLCQSFGWSGRQNKEDAFAISVSIRANDSFPCSNAFGHTEKRIELCALIQLIQRFYSSIRFAAAFRLPLPAANCQTSCRDE